VVQWHDTASAPRKSGFDSRWVHCRDAGAVPSSSGEDIPLAWGRSVVRVRPGPFAATSISFLRKGHPTRRRDPLGRRASFTALRVRLPPLPLRPASRRAALDGARGVTAARELVDLVAQGSTPAGHPLSHDPPGGFDCTTASVLPGPTGGPATPPPVSGSGSRAVPLPGRRAGTGRGLIPAPRPTAAGARHRGVLLGEQRASKTRGPGSNPGAPAGFRRWPSECAGIARDPPKVADQVRLLARASRSMTPGPDGQATDCRSVEAGSTPAGVSASTPDRHGLIPS